MKHNWEICVERAMMIFGLIVFAPFALIGYIASNILPPIHVFNGDYPD